METNKGQKVAVKILAVMKDMGRVEKDGYNDFQRYSYVSEAGMLDAIRDKIIKHGLVIIPSQISCVSTPVPGGDKSQKYLTDVCTEYTIIDTESGDSLAVKFFGQGIDTGDKGVYKATTGANKYFLMKTFMIPTGDDPEDEKERPARPQPKPADRPASRPTGNPNNPATDKQMNYLKVLLDKVDFGADTGLYEHGTDLVAKHQNREFVSAADVSTIINRLVDMLPDKK